MNPIANDSLEPSTRRWFLVGAALAAVFVAALLLLGSHGSPASGGSRDDQVRVLDNGL